MKHIFAKVLAAAQFALVCVEQASNGHFPQSGAEWAKLATSAVMWAALHKAASTDGTK